MEADNACHFALRQLHVLFLARGHARLGLLLCLSRLCNQSHGTFTEVSALVHFLCKATIETTFDNAPERPKPCAPWSPTATAFSKKKCPFRYILRIQCSSTFIPYEPTTETTFQKAPFSPFPFFIRERRVLEEAVFFTTPRPNVVEFTGYLESSWENRGAAYAQRVHIVCALCAHCVCVCT